MQFSQFAPIEMAANEGKTMNIKVFTTIPLSRLNTCLPQMAAGQEVEATIESLRKTYKVTE